MKPLRPLAALAVALAVAAALPAKGPVEIAGAGTARDPRAGGLSEAEILAYQVSDQPRPDEALVGSLDALLTEARRLWPETASIRATLDFSPDQLILTLDEKREGEVSDPTKTGLRGVDRLNERYGVEGVRTLFGSMWVLQFAEPWNQNALAKEYARVPGVKSASVDSMIGGSGGVRLRRAGREERQGDTEGARAPWRLSFTRGWGDCPSGCIHSETYTFAVDEDWEIVAYLGKSGRGEGSPDGGEAEAGDGFGIMPMPGGPRGPDVGFPSSPRPRR